MKKITSTTKLIRSDQFITATVDDDIVMMSIEKGAYFSLDETGTTIWEQLAKPVTVADICTRLEQQFDVDPAQCEADVRAFLNELAQEGMVELVA